MRACLGFSRFVLIINLACVVQIEPVASQASLVHLTPACGIKCSNIVCSSDASIMPNLQGVFI